MICELDRLVEKCWRHFLILCVEVGQTLALHRRAGLWCLLPYRIISTLSINQAQANKVLQGLKNRGQGYVHITWGRSNPLRESGSWKLLSSIRCGIHYPCMHMTICRIVQNHQLSTFWAGFSGPKKVASTFWAGFSGPKKVASTFLAI